jgi:hypothetical protein
VARDAATEAARARVSEETAQFTPAEQRQIREEYERNGSAMCPRDGAALTTRAIGGGSFGLGYARRREWLLCPKCHRSALFDLKRGTRN